MDSEEKGMGCVILVVIVFALAVGFYSLKKEAEIFNKCTGSNASMSDAFWSNLRPDKCIKN